MGGVRSWGVSAPGEVCSGRGVSAPGSGGRWGMSAPGGCAPGGSVCSQGGLLPGGVCSQGRGGVSAPGGFVSQHALRQTPPPHGQTHACENITLCNFVAAGNYMLRCAVEPTVMIL